MAKQNRNRKMRGGGILDSFSNWASNTWNTTKKVSTDAYNSLSGPSSTPSYTSSSYTSSPPPSTTSTYGGKKRKSRKYRGGYSDNIALTGLAASASHISDIKSAQPLTTVGGKRKTRRRRSSSKKRKH